MNFNKQNRKYPNVVVEYNLKVTSYNTLVKLYNKKIEELVAALKEYKLNKTIEVNKNIKKLYRNTKIIKSAMEKIKENDITPLKHKIDSFQNVANMGNKISELEIREM